MGNGKGSNLSQTCQTFLKEWYANDQEQIHSKYLDKGNYVEEDNIDFAARVLGYGLLEKNIESRSDDYFIGCCDVDTDVIIDVKSPWNRKTFLDSIEELDPNYEWQLRGYMRLYNKPKSILFYGLQNTPPEVNYGNEVTYDHLEESDRWFAFEVLRDEAIEQLIIERVIKCREWLEEHDKFIKSKIGRVIS
jgi:hypothetical protein